MGWLPCSAEPKKLVPEPAPGYQCRSMPDIAPIPPAAVKPVRVSYLFMAATLVLVGYFHMATPLLAAFFVYLALTHLHFLKRGGKTLTLVLFFVLVAAITYALAHFVHQSVRGLPEIADKAIPSVIQWAREYEIELPFTDYESLKEMALDNLGSRMDYLGNLARLARGATTQFIFVLVGAVVAISLFLNSRLELDREKYAVRNNLYSLCCDQIAQRFETLYQSFATVIGAQIVISTINTVFTTVFVVAVGLPYAVVVVGVTFLCGLIPVIGNLISNTVIVGIGFTVSPRMALSALVFLIVIHKLEYFLNSKIIGQRIRNPLWLTLLALVLGERLMGVAGMILAPVVLNYVRMEASCLEVKRPLDPPAAAP